MYVISKPDICEEEEEMVGRRESRTEGQVREQPY